jgi:enoyl-CoA hydratase/carnithine racemase
MTSLMYWVVWQLVSGGPAYTCCPACWHHALQVQVEPLSSPNEGISVISLSRSNAKNAIGRQLLRELQEAINTLRQERTTRCVLVRSTCPGTFCAGADLKVRPLNRDRTDT